MQVYRNNHLWGRFSTCPTFVLLVGQVTNLSYLICFIFLLFLTATAQPKQPSSQTVEAKLKAAVRRAPKSFIALHQAVKLKPALPKAHYRLIQLYQRAGQKTLAAQALAAFQKYKEAEATSVISK